MTSSWSLTLRGGPAPHVGIPLVARVAEAGGVVPPGHALGVGPANPLVSVQVARVQALQVGGDAGQAVGAVAVFKALGVGGWQGNGNSWVPEFQQGK